MLKVSLFLYSRALDIVMIETFYFCQFIFSTAVDGRIKAWLYDNMGSRVDYDAPGRSCTAMAYSADGTR